MLWMVPPPAHRTAKDVGVVNARRIREANHANGHNERSRILRNQKRSKASTALGPTGFNAEFHKENSLLD
jgi:hypothetical protein